MTAAAGSPRQRVEAEVARRGADALVDGCLAMLTGVAVDVDLLVVLAGPMSPRYLDAPVEQQYWLRVWPARGLLWAPWRDRTASPIAAALSDEHWRVREMAAKVVVRHRVDEAFDAITAMLDDENPRVRHAAARALRTLS
ncbi:HEAT repeat domain-containing protein [Actinoplanes sp. NBRC 103695]|uniref:HEAT repeat domain-containing protein n=1 Tax=Actinoplanes sp. NBRC 103695 TaxID=3032202 RepID=UPI0024A34690|nr:HEAT repeat domain-containing protein [Actinoplanes sp. NBRC 103695]GLZ00563.1 hypothetical protein Acsp02_78150 [Actinoplanes sp. NBRC 103695]